MRYSVQWPGHPHYIPRIRVASTSFSALCHNEAQIAAEAVLRRPLSPSLAQAREIRQIPSLQSPSDIRSRSSSSRRRALLRRKHYLQDFGWKSSLTDQTENLPRFHHSSFNSLRPFMAGENPGNKSNIDRPATLLSFDGAGHSTARKKRRERSSARQEKRALSRNPAGMPLTSATNQHLRTVHDTTSVLPEFKRGHPVGRADKVTSRAQSYDTRNIPRRTDRSSSQSLVRSNTFGANHKHRSKEPLNRPTLLDLQLQASNEVAMKPKHRGKFGDSTRSPLSTSVRRSPSERLALKKFKQELERHLQISQGVDPNPCTDATNQTLSLHTLEEFVPYRSQFNAAGLAVTSDEQRAKGVNRDGIFKLERSTIHAIGFDDTQARYGHEKLKMPDQSHVGTTDLIDTTVMGCTTPHMEDSERTQASMPSSSDHTVISFTPPHEFRGARAPPDHDQRTTRKSLPWLRRQKSLVSPQEGLEEQQRKFYSAETASFNRSEEDFGGAAVTNTLVGTTMHVENPTDRLSFVPSTPCKADISFRLSGPTNNDHGLEGEKICNLSTYKPPSFSSAGTHQSEQSISSDKCAVLTGLPESACVPHARESEATNCKSRLLKDSILPSVRNEDDQKRSVRESYGLQGFSTSDRCHFLSFSHSERESEAEIVRGEEDTASNDSENEEQDTERWPSLGKQDTTIKDSDYRSNHYSPRVCSRREPLVCQQCFPSQRTSSAISPRQVVTRKGSHFPIKQALRPARGTQFTKKTVVDNRRLKSSSNLFLTGLRTGKSSKHLSRTSSIQDSTSAGKLSDMSVFKGLHVATAAACDEDIDRWIKEITGYSVREFLAGVSRFSGLGVITLADVASRAAKQRRGEVEKWETARARAHADPFGNNV